MVPSGSVWLLWSRNALKALYFYFFLFLKVIRFALGTKLTFFLTVSKCTFAIINSYDNEKWFYIKSLMQSVIKSWMNFKTDQFLTRNLLYQDVLRALSGVTRSIYSRTDTGLHYITVCLSVFWELCKIFRAQSQKSTAVHSWHTALCDLYRFESCALGEFTWINSWFILRKKNKHACVLLIA